MPSKELVTLTGVTAVIMLDSHGNYVIYGCSHQNVDELMQASCFIDMLESGLPLKVVQTKPIFLEPPGRITPVEIQEIEVDE